jgi:hypothetical protein
VRGALVFSSPFENKRRYNALLVMLSEVETSLTISADSLCNGQTTFRDSSASLRMTKREESALSVAESVKICVNLWLKHAR